MKLLDQIERINRLHELIKHRRTGTPEELAKRLNISTAMVYKVMEELRLKDAPIEYSRQFQSYYYSQPYLMNIKMDFRPLNEDELKTCTGGSRLACYSLDRTLTNFIQNH